MAFHTVLFRTAVRFTQNAATDDSSRAAEVSLPRRRKLSSYLPVPFVPVGVCVCDDQVEAADRARPVSRENQTPAVREEWTAGFYQMVLSLSC